MSPHVADRLSAYLDAELPPAERSDVDLHLASCADCRSLLEELRMVDALARDLPELDMPEGTRDLPARVRAQLEKSRKPVVGTPWWLAAAAVLAVAVAPLLLLRER